MGFRFSQYSVELDLQVCLAGAEDYSPVEKGILWARNQPKLAKKPLLTLALKDEFVESLLTRIESLNIPELALFATSLADPSAEEGIVFMQEECKPICSGLIKTLGGKGVSLETEYLTGRLSDIFFCSGAKRYVFIHRVSQ